MIINNLKNNSKSLCFKLTWMFFFSLLLTTDMLACFCAPVKTFCELKERAEKHGAEFDIYRGVVVNVKENKGELEHIEFKILESYGQSKPMSSLKIYQGYGADCGRNISEYRAGDELIFAVYLNDFYPPKFDVCMPLPLVVRSGIVTGDIAPNCNRIALENSKNVPYCESIFTNFNVFPNPTNAILNIEFFNFNIF